MYFFQFVGYVYQYILLQGTFQYIQLSSVISSSMYIFVVWIFFFLFWIECFGGFLPQRSDFLYHVAIVLNVIFPSLLSQTVQFLISNILKWMMIKGPPHPVTFYKHMLKLGELIVLWNYSLVCKWNCLSRFVAKWVGLQTTAL